VPGVHVTWLPQLLVTESPHWTPAAAQAALVAAQQPPSPSHVTVRLQLFVRVAPHDWFMQAATLLAVQQPLPLWHVTGSPQLLVTVSPHCTW